jgi:flagellar basal-body rod modification protein FlgD
MDIVTATPSSTVTPALTSLTPPELGKNDFLNLLVAQLKNQDPLKPMDSSSFVAELAQFSQLEQSANQSKILQEVLDSQQASLQYSLLPLVGRVVRVEGGFAQLGDAPAPLDYSVSRDAASVKVAIMNASGQVVRTLDLGAQSAGAQQVTWDGRDQNGTMMQPGTYRYAVAAADAQDQAVPTTMKAQLTITGIRLEEGQPKLAAGELTIDPGAVIEFR